MTSYFVEYYHTRTFHPCRGGLEAHLNTNPSSLVLFPLMRLTPLRADALLFLNAMIWGFGFIAQRQAMLDDLTPLAFNGVRFLLGALSVIPFLILILIFKKKRSLRNQTVPEPRNWGILLKGGFFLGLIAAFASCMQQIGLVKTEAGPAGFITGLYVIFTPMIGALFGVRTNRATWIGAALAVAGMWYLGVTPDQQGALQLQLSDFLILLCALGWGIQVLIVGWLVNRADPIELTLIQFVVVALVSLLASIIFEGPIDYASVSNMFSTAPISILYSGVLAIGLAFTLQTIAQKKSPPSHVAIILAMEAPFAALGGWLILSEDYDGRKILGCSLVMIGILASQIPRILKHGAPADSDVSTQ